MILGYDCRRVRKWDWRGRQPTKVLYPAGYWNVDCVEGASFHSGTVEASPFCTCVPGLKVAGVFRHHLWQSLVEGCCWWRWWVLMTWHRARSSRQRKPVGRDAGWQLEVGQLPWNERRRKVGVVSQLLPGHTYYIPSAVCTPLGRGTPLPQRASPPQWHVCIKVDSDWLGIWDQSQKKLNSLYCDCSKPISSVWL